MALGKFGNIAFGIPSHDQRQMDIFGNIPVESLIKQIVFGRTGEIFRTAHHMGDAHEVIIDHIGKVVSGHIVAFEQNLIVQNLVFDGDLSENSIGKCGHFAAVDALADNVRTTGTYLVGSLFGAHGSTGTEGGSFVDIFIIGIFALVAEAVVGISGSDELFSVLAVEPFAFALDIGTETAIFIGTFIVFKPGAFQRGIDHIDSVFDIACLVGILDAEDEFSLPGTGKQPRIKRSTQIADMHKAGGTGGKTGSYFIHNVKVPYMIKYVLFCIIYHQRRVFAMPVYSSFKMAVICDKTIEQSSTKRSREHSGVTAGEAMMLRAYGMELLPEQLAVAEKIMLPETGIVETAVLSRALDAMDIAVPGERSRFCRGAAVLLRGFDPGSGGWFSRTDMRGAPAGEGYADRRTNMICAKVMFKMEQLTSGMAFGEAALHAVRRMKIDGIAVENSGDAEVFTLLDLCRRYLKRHPERAIPFGDGDFLLAHAPQNRAPLQLEMLPGMKIRLSPRTTGGIVRLGCRGSEEKMLLVEDLQGQHLSQYVSGIDGRHRIMLPETGAFLIYKGNNTAQWSFFNPESYAIRLPIGEKMVRFFNIRASRFTFRCGGGVARPVFRLRALTRGHSAILLLVSPGGKKFYLRDRNVDGSGIVYASELAVDTAEAGDWQLFLHSSGGSVALGSAGSGIVLER